MRISSFLSSVLIGIPVGITFLDTVGYVAKVEGVSMQPSLNPDLKNPDYVFLSRWAIRGYDIQRGEIVSITSPKVPSQQLIKRVIGLAGDYLQTRGNKTEYLQIPDGHCWLEGDHASRSADSNSFGPVSLGLITAKAICIVWPPSRWQYLRPSMQNRRVRLQWELPGTVCRHGLTIGDVDNDGDNELVVGTAEGELYIFKGSELWQKITGLGLVTSVAIGDIFNYGRNALVVICGDGWAHIFYSPRSVNPSNASTLLTQLHKEDEQEIVKPITDISMIINAASSPSSDHVDNTSEINELSGKMECVHVQRIPTNTKVVLVADIDKDGANEMILGLTDRVVRSYRWSSNTDFGSGRLVGLNKWECANQIGTVTLQHSKDGTPTLLVAQPGGTFMRIKCNAEDNRSENKSCDGDGEVAASCVDYQTLGISRMRNQNISTEIIGDLESGMISFVASLESKVQKHIHKDTLAKQPFIDDSQFNLKNIKSTFVDIKSSNFQLDAKKDTADMTGVDQVDGNIMGGNVILGEFDSKEIRQEVKRDSLLPSYEDFSHNNNNNNNNNAEVDNGKNKEDILDECKENNSKGKPYALATLDGTIMLVKDENILWAMQVDHQIFALCRLDVTNDGSDEIIACAWDGQTYILDQQRNSVRFQFEEPVRAFCTGYYSVVQRTRTPCLVYNTFNNKIFLYYDVTLPNMVISPLNPVIDLDEEEEKSLDEILGECNEAEKHRRMQQLTEWLLYGTH